MSLSNFESFVSNLHSSCALLSRGTATVLDREVEAVEVKNLYGQVIVWGMFSTDKGKFKGKLSNNAATEEVAYVGT